MSNPSPTITIQTMDGVDHELKMTFNHLNMVAAHITGADAAALVTVTNESRDRIVSVMFGKREDGKFIGADPGAIDLDMEQAGKLLDWVTEHVTDFFVKRLVKTRQMLSSIVPAVKAASDLQS